MGVYYLEKDTAILWKQK